MSARSSIPGVWWADVPSWYLDDLSAFDEVNAEQKVAETAAIPFAQCWEIRQAEDGPSPGALGRLVYDGKLSRSMGLATGSKAHRELMTAGACCIPRSFVTDFSVYS